MISLMLYLRMHLLLAQIFEEDKWKRGKMRNIKVGMRMRKIKSERKDEEDK